MNTDAFGFAYLVHLETQDGELENDKKCACVTGEKKCPLPPDKGGKLLYQDEVAIVVVV